MTTFQGKEVELDKPLYLMCGSFDLRGEKEWFPVRFGEENRYNDYKAFKCIIESVGFSLKEPGKIVRIGLWSTAISEEMHIYIKESGNYGGGAYVGDTAQKARKAIEEARNMK